MSPDSTFIGRFRIINRIAQGGMGALYLAHDPLLDREVAIKILREDFDNTELRERFSREARSVARLRHPNIVMVFDVGEQDGKPFIAMEYIQGVTLGELIRKGALALPRKLQLMDELASAIGYAHKRGIIHRDIKPANLMVDADGALKVLDFGIARIAESGMTQAGMLMGTLNYMSPEQLGGAAIDQRSDIFSVGAVYYELLSGRQAFPGGLDTGVLTRILSAAPPPLGDLCPDLDPAVIALVDRCLEKEPDRRYQDLQATRRDLSSLRRRFEADSDDDEDSDVSPDSETAVLPTPIPRTPRRGGPDRSELVRRRSLQIEAFLADAQKHMDAQAYEAAIAAGDQALLLDPDNAAATDLIDRARTALDQRQASEWIAEAFEQLTRGAITAAENLLGRALEIAPAAPRAVELRAAIADARLARDRERERQDAIRRGLDRSRAALDRGEFDEAVSAAREVIALDAGSVDAAKLLETAQAALEREALRKRVRAAIDEAQRLFKNGDPDGAIATLDRFTPPDEAIGRVRADLERQIAAARDAEEQRRRAEAERHRAEQIRAGMRDVRARLDAGVPQDALARLGTLEDTVGPSPELDALRADVQRAVEAARRTAKINGFLADARAAFDRGDFAPALAAIRQALAIDPQHPPALDMLRVYAEAERAENARREDAERQRQAALEAERRRLAEEERKRQAAIEAERKRAAGEEQKRQAAIQEQRRRADEERQRQLAIEAEQKRAAEEEQRRLAAIEEERRLEEARQKEQARRAAEAERQRLAEEERRRKAAQEEEARQRQLEAEAARKREKQKQEEARKLQQAAAAAEKKREKERREQEKRAAAEAKQRQAQEQAQLQGAAAAEEGADTARLPAVDRAAAVRPAPQNLALYIGGAAVLVAVIAFIGWRVSRSDNGGGTGTGSSSVISIAQSSVTTSALPATTTAVAPATTTAAITSSVAPPTTTAPPGAAASTFVTDARRQVTAGRLREALTTLQNGLAIYPRDPELERALRLLVNAAKADAVRARTAAAAARTSPTFAEGDRDAGEGARLERANNLVEAFNRFQSASAAFTRAASERPTSSTASIPPPVTTSVRVIEPTPSTSVTTTVPRPVTTTSVAPPPTTTSAPQPPAAADEAQIANVLRAYTAAFDALDANAVQAVYPRVNVGALRNAFAQLDRQAVTLSNVRITVQGTTATVTANVTTVTKPKAGAQREGTVAATFGFEKTARGWQIVERR